MGMVEDEEPSQTARVIEPEDPGRGIPAKTGRLRDKPRRSEIRAWFQKSSVERDQSLVKARFCHCLKSTLGEALF